MTLPSVPSPQLGPDQPMYLGFPGAMTRLSRIPDSSYTSIASRGETVHTLISGGTAVTRLPKTKRSWVLPFSGMTEDTANYLVAFYSGTMGLGPFVLVDPAWRNKFGADVSSLGGPQASTTAVNTLAGWSVSVSSAMALSNPVTAVGFSPLSDAMLFQNSTAGTKIGLGTWTTGTLVPRTADAPVYLLDQPSAVSIYAKLNTGSASATISWQANGVDALGNVQIAGSTQTTTLTSSWTRLTSYVSSGNANALYVIPTLTNTTSGATSIILSCADLQYGPTSATTLQPWVVGLGSPRVISVPGQSGAFISTSRLLPYRDQSISLAEI